VPLMLGLLSLEDSLQCCGCTQPEHWQSGIAHRAALDATRRTSPAWRLGNELVAGVHGECERARDKAVQGCTGHPVAKRRAMTIAGSKQA
jgi:hypothetical protein